MKKRKKQKEEYQSHVLKRNCKTLVGTYQKSRNFGFVLPDDRKGMEDIYIAKSNRGKAKNNDRVVVEITKYPKDKKKAEGKIIEILGKTDDENVDLLAILRAYDYKMKFPKEVQKEASLIPQVIHKIEGRVDLREKEIFTIDGDDTKDIDDAVSLEKVGENYLLGVHIADVSTYVREGTPLDHEAVKRGTSVYLIDTVIPMLPRELSNGICSLNPHEDRYALSIDILLDKDAHVLQKKIYKSVIRSQIQMTYHHVYEVVEEGKTPAGYETHVETLKKMKELALLLIAKRKQKGSIDFDLPEPKILLDENDKVISIEKREITIANRMIEQFMILANECIASYFAEKKVPFIYRVHEKPDEEKIQRLNVFLKNINCPASLPEKVEPLHLQKILESYQDTKEEKVVSTMLLRSMRLAKYSHENLGHFGLALDNYCHFTSPIRRYPDLFIHRVISDYLQDHLNEKKKIKYERLAVSYAEMSSEAERDAEEAERELEKVKMCEYMENHIGEEFDGVISGVTSFGFFVELSNMIEGLVHVENLQDDYYYFDEENVILRGKHHDHIYQMGDSVTVRVLSTDRFLRRIDFTIVNTRDE